MAIEKPSFLDEIIGFHRARQDAVLFMLSMDIGRGLEKVRYLLEENGEPTRDPLRPYLQQEIDEGRITPLYQKPKDLISLERATRFDNGDHIAYGVADWEFTGDPEKCEPFEYGLPADRDPVPWANYIWQEIDAGNIPIESGQLYTAEEISLEAEERINEGILVNGVQFSADDGALTRLSNFSLTMASGAKKHQKFRTTRGDRLSLTREQIEKVKKAISEYQADILDKSDDLQDVFDSVSQETMWWKENEHWPPRPEIAV